MASHLQGKHQMGEVAGEAGNILTSFISCNAPPRPTHFPHPVGVFQWKNASQANS